VSYAVKTDTGVLHSTLKKILVMTWANEHQHFTMIY